MSVGQIEKVRASKLNQGDYRRFHGKLVRVRVWASYGPLVGDAVGVLAAVVITPLAADAQQTALYLEHAGPIQVKSMDEVDISLMSL